MRACTCLGLSLTIVFIFAIQFPGPVEAVAVQLLDDGTVKNHALADLDDAAKHEMQAQAGMELDVGRRGGGALMTSGSFTMMSSNRAGNSEDDEEEDDKETEQLAEPEGRTSKKMFRLTALKAKEQDHKKISKQLLEKVKSAEENTLGETVSVGMHDSADPVAKAIAATHAASASQGCNWQCYLNRYKDLQKAFGATNVKAAEAHWKNHGQKEKRDCTCPAGSTRRRRFDWGKLPSTRAANPAAVVSRLEGLPYADLAEIVTGPHMRTSRDNPRLLNPGSKGDCLTDYVSSTASSSSCFWGGRAFTYLCATHSSTYTKDDNAGKKGFIHPVLYAQCGNDATACLVKTCAREDDSSLTRKGYASQLTLPEVTGFGNTKLEVYFSVTCQKRKKLMVCPLEKGYTSITKCTVKKECGSYSAPVPRASLSGGVTIWGQGIGGDHPEGYGLTHKALTSTHKSIWEMVIRSPAMKAQFVSACAVYCGFF